MLEDILEVFSTFTLQQMMWLMIASVLTFVFYKLTSALIKRVILKAKGTEGDAKMIVNLWRFAVSFLAELIIVGSFFHLGLITTVVGAFGGMFLG